LSFETSAKENLNVGIAFEEIAFHSFEKYMKRISSMKIPTVKSTQLLKVEKDQNSEKKDKCC